MTSSASLAFLPAATRSSLCVLVLALTVATLLPSSTARAGNAPRETIARPGVAPSAPPDFPDAIHVPNGCYISTAAFLVKFSAAFPSELAVPLTIEPNEYPGPHTVALVSWQNQWWLRDEFLGVFSLNQPVGDAGVTDRLRRTATAAVDRRATRIPRHTRFAIARHSAQLATGAVSARDVATAAKLLPCPSEPFRITCRHRDTALLFFRPGAGCIAVYDPLTGTALAEIDDDASSARIVKLVAARLGYQATAIDRVVFDPIPLATAPLASSR